MPNEPSDLTKEFSKQWVEGADWILLAAFRKMLDEKNKLKDGLLSKKEPGHDKFENAQTLQMDYYVENNKYFQARIKSRAPFEEHGLKVR